MQHTMPTDGTASDMFIDAHESGYGNSYIECRCGIEHYAINQYQDEEDPPGYPEESDKVKHHDDNFILAFDLDGQLYVDDCESCKKQLRRYEDFIWNNRDHIRNYLKVRIDQEKKWADQEHLLNVLAGIK